MPKRQGVTIRNLSMILLLLWNNFLKNRLRNSKTETKNKVFNSSFAWDNPWRMTCPFYTCGFSYVVGTDMIPFFLENQTSVPHFLFIGHSQWICHCGLQRLACKSKYVSQRHLGHTGFPLRPTDWQKTLTLVNINWTQILIYTLLSVWRMKFQNLQQIQIRFQI